MSNELSLFNFEGHELGAIHKEGEAFFVGNDAAKLLGYKNYRAAINSKVDKEDKLRMQIGYAGQKRMVTMINESGLYSLIFSSNLETAKKFKRWVTNEVLPTIRKTGAYMTDDVIENLLQDPDSFVKMIQQVQKEKQKRREIENKLKLIEPKAKYAEEVLESNGSLNIGQIAKEFGMSAAKLNEVLHGLKIQYKTGGQWVLYSQYQELGYVDSETTTFKKKDGSKGAAMRTKWTQKGREFIHSELAKINIKPLK